MKKNVFVAIDGSTAANQALAEAISMALAFKARLCITFVADEAALMQHGLGLGTFINVDKIKEEIRAGANKMLQEAMARAQAAGCPAEHLLIESADRHVAESIVHAAQSWGADLLVVGAHGGSGIKRLLVGRVAENLTRISPISLLVVRQA